MKELTVNIAMKLAETMNLRGAQLAYGAPVVADGGLRFIPNLVALVSVVAPSLLLPGLPFHES